MSVAREIPQHLPYLRRFARALTGSQIGGDAYVAATLEALIVDPSIFPQGMPLRHALYKLFLKLWASAHVDEKRIDLPQISSAADRNLEMLAMPPRQAFLLNAVEGFAVPEVALILDKSLAETSGLLEEAGREIARQIATSVLIIEDEPIIALDIEAMVLDLGHEVTGIARTHREALALAAKRPPGLILADIQLADGSSGLDAANEILQSIDVPIIFITAYPERLLTGEKPEPAFLITKPFHTATVKAAISQALFFDRRAKAKAP